MVAWWQEQHEFKDATVVKQDLYRRLRDAVTATHSPGENVLFDIYYRKFGPQYKAKLPALIPRCISTTTRKLQCNVGWRP